MTLQRIQRKRIKGWRMPENTIYVGRPSRYGNPWVVGKQGIETAQEAVDLYRYHLKDRNLFPELRGKNLACWCALDKPCHADVLLEIVNG